MPTEAIDALVSLLGIFGGISLLVWTSTQAKIARIKAERNVQQPNTLTDSAVLAEIKALQQQMAEMHSTSHRFDISFDEALSRLENRVNRLETKSTVATTQQAETPNTLRNGQNQ